MIGTEIHQTIIDTMQQGRRNMTDLRVDPLAFLVDDRDEDGPETSTADEVAAAAKANEAKPGEADTVDTETKARLEKLGLDHVPTVAEAKAILDARKEEIRREVLIQADARDWCYDGTRQVCANLRLAKPDDRTRHTFTTRVVLEVEVEQNGFTKEGAIARMQRANDSYGGYLSARWFSAHMGGSVTVRSAIVDPIDADGTIIQLGDAKGEGR